MQLAKTQCGALVDVSVSGGGGRSKSGVRAHIRSMHTRDSSEIHGPTFCHSLGLSSVELYGVPAAHANQSTCDPGTPLYMSPEQCRGEPYSRSADVWSVGCVLYELMSLDPPWLGQVQARSRMWRVVWTEEERRECERGWCGWYAVSRRERVQPRWGRGEGIAMKCRQG